MQVQWLTAIQAIYCRPVDLQFLDSPEQALVSIGHTVVDQADPIQLVVPNFTDIKPEGGGTYIAPESIGKIAGYLAAHPEGVMPRGFDFLGIRDSCDKSVKLTGDVGDVSPPRILVSCLS